MKRVLLLVLNEPLSLAAGCLAYAGADLPGARWVAVAGAVVTAVWRAAYPPDGPVTAHRDS